MSSNGYCRNLDKMNKELDSPAAYSLLLSSNATDALILIGLGDS